MGWCESPIEQLVMAAMLSLGPDVISVASEMVAFRCCERLAATGVTKTVIDFERVLSNPREQMFVCLQLPIEVGAERYRADMAVIGALAKKRFVIELDGHDFHERTKEQASRDKRRDRAMSLAGWTILRFTGSEVVKGPMDVACDVLDAMSTAHNEAL